MWLLPEKMFDGILLGHARSPLVKWPYLFFTLPRKTLQHFHGICPEGESRAFARMSRLTIHIESCLENPVRSASGNEWRSPANMTAVMIRNYCGQMGGGRVDRFGAWQVEPGESYEWRNRSGKH
jgi:hypothetical protein